MQLFNRNKESRFDHLYSQYARMMFLLALRYVSVGFDAEEVVQRGFIKVYKSLPGFSDQGEKALKGWISKIIINEALLFLREQKKFSFQVIPENDIDIEIPEIEKELNYESCLSYVRELPDGFRTIFNLYAIEGYSHQEIAEMLGITESTSRSQLCRARNILKLKLTTEKYHEEIAG